MKHIILLVAMAITCILAAVANVILTRMIGLNIFTFKLWFIIPAGAIGVDQGTAEERRRGDGQG